MAINKGPSLQHTDDSKEKIDANKKAQEAAKKKAALAGTMARSNEEARNIGNKQASSLDSWTLEKQTATFAKDKLGVNKASKIDKTSNKLLNSFNRLKNFEGVDFATGGIGYVFFTPLDMNLVRHKAGRSELYGFLEYLALTEEGKQIISYFDVDYYAGLMSCNDPRVNGRIFMNLLTNMSKGFETKDTSLDITNRESFMGYRTSIPATYTDSISTDSFTINYYETRDLYVLKLHKLWVDYMHNVRRGHYMPKDKYRKARILDYMSSMYFILVGEDGMEIKYWAKYTGVYPVNIPYSAMSWHGFDNPGIKELSITYNYNYKEDMDVSAIIDFAKYASASNGSSGTVSKSLIRPAYEKGNQIMKEMWAMGVGVSVHKGRYYLLFDHQNIGLKQSKAKFQDEIAGKSLKFPMA